MMKRQSTTPIAKSAKRPKLNANQTMLDDAKVVVGIDFGTTFSGFAYALKANPEKVSTFYDWPCQAAAGARPYCKTQTSLWYLPVLSTGGFYLKDWGWPAQVNHCQALQANWNSCVKATAEFTSPLTSRALRRSKEHSTCGHFLTKFKLLLSPAFKGESLPEGLSAEQLISDYLKQLSTFIMCELNKSGQSIILKKDVQWCLTVPTIWTHAAKQTMIDCSEMAGLVTGPHCQDEDASLHPILIVLEPEAASLYCLQKHSLNFKKGSKFLIIDAGGGTVDVVVHEKVDDTGLRVKEATCSTGDLCGGSFVDKAFMDYLTRRIDCLEKFSAEYPTKISRIKRDWEDFKCCFDGKGDPYVLELPPKLADAWETHEKTNIGDVIDARYDELVITTEDMRSIFDGQVNKIIKLIKDQLMQVPQVEAIMVVGGFSNSPYLMKRICDKFSHLVKQIVRPPDPGSAICQGAVAFGALGPDIMMSRKSRKTYGMCMYREFQQGDPKGSLTFDEKGEALCKDSFCVFTRVGEDVPVDHCVTHCDFVPVNRGERSIKFTMYSTSAPEPKFVTESGVVKVGSWLYPLPASTRKMKNKPCVDVTFFFGRTRIEVSAQPRNFKGGKTSLLNVLFERDLD